MTSYKEEKFSMLDAKFFPECWSDDIRMDNLMAPFRVKSVNPNNYDAKLTFWYNLIVKYCEYKRNSAVSLDELCSVFRRGDKRPYGLQTVLSEMLAIGKIQFKNQFMEEPQETWSGWAIYSAKKCAKWGFRQVVERVTKPQIVDSSYIVLEAVQVIKYLL